MSLTDFIDLEDMDDESEFDSSGSDTSDDDSEFELPTMWSSATQWGSYRDDDLDEDNS